MDAEVFDAVHITRAAAAVDPNRQVVPAALREPRRPQAGPRTSGGRAAGGITVMIASGRPPLVAAWSGRLAREPGIDLRAEPPTDPAGLASRVERQPPQVLLLDKPLLDRLDTGALQAVRQQCEHMRVLLLWDELASGLVVDVLRYHFHGFLPTTCLPEVCVKAIRAVSQGELWLSRAALADAVAELLQAPGAPATARPAVVARTGTAPSSLTRREKQIVELLRRGCTNKEIAHELGVMEDTVKKHLQSVFAKLGVRRRALVALRPQASS